MTRPVARLIAALVAVIAIAAVPTADAGPSAATKESALSQAGPEHARLTAMCGTWDVEITFWFKPGGPGLTTKGTSTIRPLFDGRFVEEKIEGTLNGTPFTTLAWTGFNTATHQLSEFRQHAGVEGRGDQIHAQGEGADVDFLVGPPGIEPGTP